MKLKGSILLCFLLILQSTKIRPLKTDENSLCTKPASFTKVLGYVLLGFVVGEMSVTSFLECSMRCAIAVNCLSSNMLTNADGSFTCQLNKGIKDNDQGQFVPHPNGEYLEFVGKQKPCKDGETACATTSSAITSWHAFNQSYFALVATEVNFNDALKSCRARKGDLASISSDEERTFLFKTFVNGGKYTFLGLNDIDQEGSYVWTDGSPVTYARFAQGQPNGGAEDCVVMLHDGYLHDILCSTLNYFFCETNYNVLYP
ncbi:collectin-10-like [Dendronephthya gigantea]|uniref:collectin-10-like n=1 Tax=Dendronephthya gigantea TaxID=151771 RepID=UPI00106AA134|nr:collectin-10-like [Dendronephthya gigantea]